MMEARLIEIEVKLSYAEDALEELNKVVWRQQEQISRLENLVVQLAQRMQDLTPPEQGAPQEERPPHY